MATIIDGGLDAFRAAAYGTLSHRARETLNDMGRRYDSLLGARARDYFGSVRERLFEFNLDNARRRGISAWRGVKTAFMQDRIQYLSDIASMQHAPDSMVPWIMADLEVDKRFRKGEVEGYGLRYKDVFNMSRQTHNPYYQRVMDGAWVERDGVDYYTEYWLTDESEMIPEISVDEVHDIRQTWDRIRLALDAMDDDPTSEHNAKL